MVAKKCHVQTPRDSAAVEWLGFLPGFRDSQKEKLHLAWAMFLLWYMANVFLLKNDKIQRERENFFMIMMSSKDKAGLGVQYDCWF